MNNNLITAMPNNIMNVITSYAQGLYDNPLKLIVLIVDIAIVILLFTKLFKIVKDSRAWQLLKGIAFLIIAMGISSLLHLDILNYILTSFVTYGTVFVVLFQPELRRSLEELRKQQANKIFWNRQRHRNKNKRRNI